MASVNLSTGAHALTSSGVGGGALTVQTNTNNALFVDGNGNVGIGTTMPMAKLDVNGTIKLQNHILQKKIISYSQPLGSNIETYSTSLINSGISINITPISNLSKMLITFISSAYTDTAAIMVYIYRNGINQSGSNGSRTGDPFNASAIYSILTASTIDTHNSNSQLTYSIWYKSMNGNRSILIHEGTNAVLTVEEII